MSFPRRHAKGSSWDTPVSAPLFAWMQAGASPEAPSNPAASRHSRRTRSRTHAHSRTDECVDGAMPAQAVICHDMTMEQQRVCASRKPVQRNLRRSQSEVPVYAVSAGTKRKAVSALQQFFFEELSRGNDTNGAAASALMRLNELAAGNQAATPTASSIPKDLFPTMLHADRKRVAERDAASDDESSGEEEEFQRQRQELR